MLHTRTAPSRERASNPQAAADQASQAVRILSHETLNPAALSLGEAYDVPGSLLELFGRLPQALRQLGASVAHEPAGQTLYSDDGTDPATHLSTVLALLQGASAACECIASSCCLAHASLGRLGTEGKD